MKNLTIAVALGTVLVLAGCANTDTDTIADDEAALLDARERPQLPAIVVTPALTDEEMASLEHRNYPKLPGIGE